MSNILIREGQVLNIIPTETELLKNNNSYLTLKWNLIKKNPVPVITNFGWLYLPNRKF